MVLENFGANLKKQLVIKGLAKPEEILGCSHVEVQELCNAQGVSYLPAMYRSFLLAMGKCAGNLFLRDLDYKFTEVLTLKNTVVEYVTDDGISIPDDAFVFASYRYSAFLFFQTANELEDPPVYCVYCNDAGITEFSKTLSGFFEQQLRWHEGILWDSSITGQGVVSNIGSWFERRIRGLINILNDK